MSNKEEIVRCPNCDSASLTHDELVGCLQCDDCGVLFRDVPGKQDFKGQLDRATELLGETMGCQNNWDGKGVCPQCREAIEKFLKTGE